MIAYLKGTVKFIFDDGLVLDVNGVGYKIMLDSRTLGSISVGSEGEFLIRTTFSSDAITLYGFARREEHDLFERLITVSGIGAKTALGMLSRMSAEEIVSAIAQKNIAALTRLPGLGKKTVERLILELHDKLKLSSTAAALDRFDRQAMIDATDALEALGYSQSEIASVLSRVNEPLSTEELIKLALKELN